MPPVSEETWSATLQEVGRQALLHLRGSLQAQADELGSGSDLDWVQVEPDADETEPCAVWPESQWHSAFDLLFCQAPASVAAGRPHQDDLLLFAYLRPPAVRSATGSPLFVRRRAAGGLGAELRWGSPKCCEVDWRASVLLNLAMQTAYSLTVSVCRRADLGMVAAGGEHHGTSIVAVEQAVFPSPSRVHVNLDSSRSEAHAQPAPCYPGICFAVEDFDHAFASQVLQDPESCYCVVLHAHARESWCLPDAISSNGLSQRGDPGASTSGAAGGAGGAADAQPGSSVGGGRPVLFSGFVSHEQLAAALAGRLREPPWRLRRAPGGGGSTTRVLMNGPGGLGSADVAVTALPADGRHAAGPNGRHSEEQEQGHPTANLFKRAAFLARGALDAAVGARDLQAERSARLQCALMTLLVPVDILARGILQALLVVGGDFCHSY